MDLPWIALIIIVVIVIVLMIIHTQTSPDDYALSPQQQSPELLVPEYMRKSQPPKQNNRRREWIDKSFRYIQYLDTSNFPEIGGELHGTPTRDRNLGRLFVGNITYIESAGSSNDGRTFRVTTDLCPSLAMEGSAVRSPFLVRVYTRNPYHPA